MESTPEHNRTRRLPRKIRMPDSEVQSVPRSKSIHATGKREAGMTGSDEEKRKK